jgi:hypothetical protein
MWTPSLREVVEGREEIFSMIGLAKVHSSSLR